MYSDWRACCAASWASSLFNSHLTYEAAATVRGFSYGWKRAEAKADANANRPGADVAAGRLDFKQTCVMMYGGGHPYKDEVMVWPQLIRSWH